MGSKYRFYVTRTYAPSGQLVSSVQADVAPIIAGALSDAATGLLGGMAGASLWYGLNESPWIGFGVCTLAVIVAGKIAPAIFNPPQDKSDVSDQEERPAALAPAIEPDATRTYRNAMALLGVVETVWYRGEDSNARKAVKPWSFRSYQKNGVLLDVEGIPGKRQQDAWEEAISMWVSAGLIKSASDTNLVQPFSRARSMLKTYVSRSGFTLVVDRGKSRLVKRL